MNKLLLLCLFLSVLATCAMAQTAPATFDLSTGLDFSFTSHSGTTLPTNIAVGWQNSGTDGEFTNALTNNASNGTNVGLWNAEGANGISYRGGSGEQRGSFLMVLNTTNRQNITVSWTVNVISALLNTNYIELQYRIGTSGSFNQIDEGGESDLFSTAVNSSGDAFSATLPSACDNQSTVQLRWVYYEIGTDTRWRLALDDIGITSTCIAANQATNFGVQQVDNDFIDYFFTRGNGDAGVLVLCREGSAVDANPTDGTAYAADEMLGAGDEIGTDNFVIYNGVGLGTNTATAVLTVSNLLPTTDYHFAVYEYQAADFPCYKTPPLTFSQTSLPVELLRFTATPSERGIELNWQTASERDNDFFEIQHSRDGLRFSAIGKVPGNGQSNVLRDYRFLHVRPAYGDNYYRLRQVDFDKTEHFGPVRTAYFEQKNAFSLAPTLANASIGLLFDEPLPEAGLWKIFDWQGRAVASGEIEAEREAADLPIDNLPAGAFWVQVSVGRATFTGRFFKN